MVTAEGGDESAAVEYEPVGVKQLLVSMKDVSELMVDLAYSALLHNSDALADEVLELESRMDVLQMQARMNTLMAARTTTDSKQLAPVLGIIGAAEKISEAAGDIATVVLGDEELPGSIRAALPDAMEVLARATVDDGSPYEGRTLGEIDLETETGVRVIGVHDEEEWVLTPNQETRLDAGDVLLLRGAEYNLSTVYETATGTPYEQPEESESDITDLRRAVDTIVLMKNVSELSVDLAYASVLLDDTDLAQEVHALEVEVDSLQSRLEAWILQAATEVDQPVRLRGLLHLASSTELISDAALEITEGILRDIDTHPVITESVRESDVAVRRVEVHRDSELAGKTVAGVLEANPGVSVIAIRRSNDEWVFYPDGEEQVDAGDRLIARGTWNATEKLVATVRG
ncbi:potassium channel family protein [Halovenus salina]|uniref:potassium channel family protein n=1 Tax=Halovenus salina TaxID=1510225 RepID=UPI002260FA8E|nr:TrkA C-terminal domain-containing protein [Halovenus salina]